MMIIIKKGMNTKREMIFKSETQFKYKIFKRHNIKQNFNTRKKIFKTRDVKLRTTINYEIFNVNKY